MDQLRNIGRVVKGTVFDCNKKYLERRLKDIEPRLYLKWNSEKNRGRGLWELKIMPSRQTLVSYGEWNGGEIKRLEYVEDYMVHHILDLPCLHLGVLDQLREMDTRDKVNHYKSITDHIEDVEESVNAKAYAKLREDLKYKLQQERKYLKVLQEAVLSGISPAAFFSQSFRDKK